MNDQAKAMTTVLEDLPDPRDPSACMVWLRERYLKNPRDDLLVETLGEILHTAPDGTLTANPIYLPLTRETRGLLVIGATGDGKTALIRRNLQRNPNIGLTDGMEPGKALYVRVPAEATLKGGASDILKKTGYPTVSDKIRTSDVWDMALHRLKMRGIRILWIDEAHHMLHIKREAEAVLHRLKTLMQVENRIALIVSGVLALDEMIQTAPETSERFFRMHLKPIRTKQERESLYAYIAKCCSSVQLSLPDDQNLVARLEMATNSSLGRSLELTFSAIGRALRRGDGHLTLSDFKRSLDFRRGYPDDGPFDPEDWVELKTILQEKGADA